MRWSSAGYYAPMEQRQDVRDTASYIQVHLTGAAAGIELFGIAGRRLTDDSIRAEVKRIRTELKDERARLTRMVKALGSGDAKVFSALSRLGAQVARVGPGGSLARTPLSDLLLLETMRDAVAGKIAGWHTLLSVVDEHPELDRQELEDLLRQGEVQHDHLTEAHRTVASRVLSPHRK